MTGAGRLAALALAAAALMWAAGGGPGEHHDSSTLWKSLNFLVLAAGLGYLIRKLVRPYLASRTAAIQNEIAEAARLRQEAEARATETAQRLAAVGAEIEKLRSEARREMEEEEARLRAETERALARMRASAEMEIASITKRARQELKAYAAELALSLAQEKIRRRMTPEAAHALVDSFVRNLDRRPGGIN